MWNNQGYQSQQASVGQDPVYLPHDAQRNSLGLAKRWHVRPLMRDVRDIRDVVVNGVYVWWNML